VWTIVFDAVEITASPGAVELALETYTKLPVSSTSTVLGKSMPGTVAIAVEPAPATFTTLTLSPKELTT
jgi:hypothetical protein